MATTRKKRPNIKLILSSILQSSLDMAVIATDLDMRILYGNAAVEKVYGCKDEDIIGKTVMEVHDKLNMEPARIKRAIDIAKDKGEYSFTVELRRKMNHSFVKTRVSCIWDSQNKLIGYVLSSQDITRQKLFERKLTHISKEWEETFDSISDAVSIHDNDFIINKANKAFADMVNMDRAEIIGKKCYEIVHGFNKPGSLCPHKKTCNSGKACNEEFYEPFLGIHVEASTSPLFNDKGKLVGAVHITKNIDERKKAENILRNIAEKISEKTGKEYFQSLVEFIAKELNSECALIGELNDEGQLEYIAAHNCSEVLNKHSVSRKDSPCHSVLDTMQSVYYDNVQDIFPRNKVLSELGATSYAAIPLLNSEEKPLGLIAVIGCGHCKSKKNMLPQKNSWVTSGRGRAPSV